MAGELLVNIARALLHGRKAWKERCVYVYKYDAGDGDRQKDLRWLTCVVLIVMCNVARRVDGGVFTGIARPV